MVIPTGHTPLDGALIVLSFFLGASCWGGFDLGNIKRLFSIVPQQRQSLYMAVFMIGVTASVAFGSFLGGQIIHLVRAMVPEPDGAEGFRRLLAYRVLYLVAAIGTVAAVGYSRRMMAFQEVSAMRLLLYLRIRAERTLMSALPGNFIRKMIP